MIPSVRGTASPQWLCNVTQKLITVRKLYRGGSVSLNVQGYRLWTPAWIMMGLLEFVFSKSVLSVYLSVCPSVCLFLFLSLFLSLYPQTIIVFIITVHNDNDIDNDDEGQGRSPEHVLSSVSSSIVTSLTLRESLALA